MHLFLQICGVVGFGLLGFVYPGFLDIKSGQSYSSLRFAIKVSISFALISTYFIFG